MKGYVMEGPVSVKDGVLFKKRHVGVTATGDVAILEEPDGTKVKKTLRSTQLTDARRCAQHTKDNCALLNGSVHIQGSQALVAVLIELCAATVAKNTSHVQSFGDDTSVVGGGAASLMRQTSTAGVNRPPKKEDKMDAVAREFVPRFPVVLIPGLASSALDVVKSMDSEFEGRRLWIGLGALASGRVFGKDMKQGMSQSSPALSTEHSDLASFLGGAAGAGSFREERETDVRASNKWIKHMCLAESRDGFSDPPGIVVRPVPGVAGCAFLSKEKLTSPLSYVFGFVVDALAAAGYVEGKNLMAATYDWRCALPRLESKYAYFSTLKRDIEELVKRNNGARAVLLAHSMGNRVMQYFLHWVKHTDSQQWIDSNIEGLLACGAPWLGAPKILRSLATGNRMDLDLFLNESEGHELLRSCGSLPSLLPMRFEETDSGAWRFPWTERRFVLHTNGKHLTQEEVFLLGGLCSATEMLKVYDADPVWKLVREERPPVKSIWNLIGTNLETELCYAFIEEGRGFVLNSDSQMERCIELPGFRFEQGILFESGKLGNDDTSVSGDATVPLASLMHATTEWGAALTVFPHAEHRAMLRDPRVLKSILQCVAQPRAH